MGLFDMASQALFVLPPETAHNLSIAGLKTGLVPCPVVPPDDRLEVRIAGLVFPNPVGIAAGYDKNAEVPDALLKLGFGFAEVGTVTPRPQAGNPRPRIFRLAPDEAVINRLGFNNEGHAPVLARLQSRSGRGGIVGVNIGANKDADDFVADYEKGIDKFFDVASYFTANISSPNTPGLRNLQAARALEVLLGRIAERLDAQEKKHGHKVPVFLKIAPDLTEAELKEIADVIKSSRLDGLIISNTTLERDGIADIRSGKEAGGLSGKPLFSKSTRILAKMRKLLGPHMPIIGVGGISGAQDVIEKMEAGANLVQLYTGMIYKGPGLPSEIVHGLVRHLNKTGLANIGELTATKTDEWCREPCE